MAASQEETPAPSSLSEELTALTSHVPPRALLTCTAQFVRFALGADSPTKSLVVTCQFPDGYPSSPLHVELTSYTLQADLVEKLQSICDREAERRAAESAAPQALHIYQTLHSIFHNNKLLLCTSEIAKLRPLITGDKEWLTLSEKNGCIKLHVEEKEREFQLEFELRVGPNYPVDPVKLKCLKTTFPSRVTQMFFNQADDIARRCSQGCHLKDSLRDSDPAKPPPEVLRLSAVSQFKHDVKFIKEKAEWGAIATNRKTRQKMKLFEKREVELEDQKAKEDALMESIAEGGGSGRSDMRSTIALPSVLAVAEYLISKFVRLLPNARCVQCQELLIENLKSFDSDNPPERAYCGHWFHNSCLEQVMLTPPFGLQCPGGCGSQVFHAKWTSDVKALERRWATREAHRREEEEILDLLDLKQ